MALKIIKKSLTEKNIDNILYEGICRMRRASKLTGAATSPKFVYIVFFFLIIFSGCSIKEATKNGPDGGELRERVAAYWQLKVEEDFMKSYEYEAPYYRKQTNMMNYLKGINTSVVKYLTAAPADVKIDGDSARVNVQLRVRVKPPQMKSDEYTTQLTEKWVKVDGVWYHVPGVVDQRGVN
jgi:hypothetical protein